MSAKSNSILLYVLIIVVSSSLNFLLFLEAYKRLAFPYLNEEQRVENAPSIFLYVLPSFVLVSVLTILLIRFISNKFDKS